VRKTREDPGSPPQEHRTLAPLCMLDAGRPGKACITQAETLFKVVVAVTIQRRPDSSQGCALDGGGRAYGQPTNPASSALPPQLSGLLSLQPPGSPC
jgi:hypothetical protein